MKFGLLTASLALVAATTACGGPAGADAPKDATTEDFCKVVNGIGVADDPADVVDELVEVGTPKDIPSEARQGFEVTIDSTDEDDLSDSDQKKVDAFVEYFLSACLATP